MSSNKSKSQEKPILDISDLEKIDQSSSRKDFISKPVNELDLGKEGEEEFPPTDMRRYTEEGKKRRSVPIQLQGLSARMLPPLMRKKLATYEVISNGEVDPLTHQPIDAPPLILPSMIQVFDPFEMDPLKRHKMIRNVTRQEIVTENGRQIMKDAMEDIIIDKYLSVSCDRNYLLFAFLELHPLNASNKFRDKSQAPAFRRVDINKQAWGDSLAVMDLAWEAENIVRKMSEPDKIIALATSAGIPTAGRVLEGDRSVKYDLRILARQSPREFFKLDKTNAVSVKMAVTDAINLGLVEYNVDTRNWHFSTDGSKIGGHLPNEDPTLALVKLLQKEEYRDVYTVLQDQLNYWD